jgi:hypothetical protein
MKSSTIRTLIAAAALAVAAGTASAQTYKAEIPMSFRAGNKVMAPGAYEIKVSVSSAGSSQVLVKNVDSGSMVFLLPHLGDYAPAAWQSAGKPVFAFECAEGHCALRTIWTGQDLLTYQFSTPHADKQLAEVLVPLTRSE